MEKEKNISFLDLLTMGLSIYVIIIFGIDEFVKLPLQISILLTYIDDCICFIFIFDLFYRLYLSENKLNAL